MALLKQIDEKGAVLAWSPKFENPNLIALGTKVDFLFIVCKASLNTLNRILRELDLMIMEENWSSINWISPMHSIQKLLCWDLSAPGLIFNLSWTIF